MEFEILKPTHQQFLNGEVSFEEYYLALALECGISYEASDLLSAVRKAIREGDDALFSIPVYEWETRAKNTQIISEFIFKQHGDTWCPEWGVRMHKVAAIYAARQKEMK